MMAIVRNSGEAYSVRFEPMDVHEIANQVRSVPAEFINGKGNYVTDECIHYLAPLIRGEAAPVFENGSAESVYILIISIQFPACLSRGDFLQFTL